MTVEQFVKELYGVRQTSQGWSACCPAHDDADPSLGIAIGSDGRILVHCFAGCSVQEICEALNLKIRNLFPSRKNDPAACRSQRRRKCERIRQRQAALVRGHQVDVMREAECLIKAARSIDISGWSPNRLNQELERLARAYAALEKEWRNE